MHHPRGIARGVANSRPAHPTRPPARARHHAGSFFQKAKTALLGMQVLVPDIAVEVVEHPDRDSFRAWWFAKREALGPRAAGHTSSPAVWLGGTDVSAAGGSRVLAAEDARAHPPPPS
jgi:hypothetical protein